MKCMVIYFSMTGNTRKVAEAIYSGIKSAGEPCDIVKLKEADSKDLSRYDLIGLGSPIHYFEPVNVRHFVKSMVSIEGKHGFIFSTHCTRPEAFIPSMMEVLLPTGMIIIGTGDWYGSHNDQQFPKPFLTDGHPDEIDLREAAEFGKEMVARSQRIKAGEKQLIPVLEAGRELGRQLAEQRVSECTDETQQFPPGVDMKRWKQTQNFKLNARLNTRKCKYPECRICVDNCPVEGIDLSASPPRFAEPCMNCLHCEKICPEGAIEVDFREAARIFRWRTEHVYGPILARSEAEGKFRRLVPLDKVGWDTPYYQVFSHHPRYIIT
jgi:ferredoxin